MVSRDRVDKAYSEQFWTIAAATTNTLCCWCHRSPLRKSYLIPTVGSTKKEYFVQIRIPS
jgi:hypothetical protein